MPSSIGLRETENVTRCTETSEQCEDWTKINKLAYVSIIDQDDAFDHPSYQLCGTECG